MKRHNVKWQVSLSNGETIFEDKGSFLDIEGQPSPWQRLLLHLAETGARITSLSLYHDDGRRWNLPSSGNRPKFQAFDQAEKPMGFACFRKVGFDVINTTETVEVNPSKQDWFTVAQAEFSDGFLEIWVNERDPKHTWTLFLRK